METPTGTLRVDEPRLAAALARVPKRLAELPQLKNPFTRAGDLLGMLAHRLDGLRVVVTLQYDAGRFTYEIMGFDAYYKFSVTIDELLGASLSQLVDQIDDTIRRRTALPPRERKMVYESNAGTGDNMRRYFRAAEKIEPGEVVYFGNYGQELGRWKYGQELGRSTPADGEGPEDARHNQHHAASLKLGPEVAIREYDRVTVWCEIGPTKSVIRMEDIQWLELPADPAESGDPDRQKNRGQKDEPSDFSVPDLSVRNETDRACTCSLQTLTLEGCQCGGV